MRPLHLLCPLCAPEATRCREVVDDLVPVAYVEPDHIGAVWIDTDGWLWCHHRIYAPHCGPTVAPDWVLARETEIQYNGHRGKGA